MFLLIGFLKFEIKFEEKFSSKKFLFMFNGISFDGNEIIFILFLNGEMFFFGINFNNFSLKNLSVILNEIN